ncbi:MAG: VanZ family protein [Gaiellales bacterium]
MRLLACLPAAGIAVLIWVLSSTPDLAIASGWLDTVTRKAAHIGVFGLLCAACVMALRAQGIRQPPALVGGALLALAYAGADEYHQTFVPTRHGAPVDVAIDAVGIGIAVMVLVVVYRHRGRRWAG